MSSEVIFCDMGARFTVVVDVWVVDVRLGLGVNLLVHPMVWSGAVAVGISVVPMGIIPGYSGRFQIAWYGYLSTWVFYYGYGDVSCC